MWLLVTTFIFGMETIVWHGASTIKAPVWCDVCTMPMFFTFVPDLMTSTASHIGIIIETGIPACSLVITRHISNICRLTRVEPPSKSEVRDVALM